MKAMGRRSTAKRPGNHVDFQSPRKGHEKESATNFIWGSLTTLTSDANLNQ
jgi:hypothetical protein